MVAPDDYICFSRWHLLLVWNAVSLWRNGRNRGSALSPLCAFIFHLTRVNVVSLRREHVHSQDNDVRSLGIWNCSHSIFLALGVDVRCMVIRL